MSFDFGDIVEGQPSRIVDPVPDHAVGKIITACNNDLKQLARGHVEIITTEGKRYWMVEGTVKMVLPKKPKFSEHEKLAKVAAQSQAICEFLEWATSDKGFQFGRDIPVEPEPPEEPVDSIAAFGNGLVEMFTPKTFFQKASGNTVQDLAAEFFGIDLKKIEAEKRLMLKYAQFPPMWMD